MNAYGLPDWSAPVGPMAYAGYGAPSHVVLPHALTLAADADGAPDFRFVAYREARAGDGDGHGVLDARVVAAYDLAGGDVPQAVARGFLRTEWLAEAITALAPPEPLWWSAGGEARIVQRIGQDGVALVERTLHTALPLVVVADVEIDGVAPRVDARAELDVRRLVDALREGGDVVARDVLRTRIAQAPETLGIVLRATPEADANTIVTALVDQLRARVLGFAPSRSGDEAAMLALPATVAATRLVLDLSAPCIAPRPLRLVLAPFDEAARLAGRPWQEIVEWRERLPLVLGETRFRITTNLPGWPADTLRLIATLRLAPDPPSRPQAVSRSVALDPTQPDVDIGVRLGRDEAPRWTMRVDAVLPGDGTVLRVAGPTFDGDGTAIAVGPAQAPLALARASATSALLALADVELTPAAGDETGLPLRLDAASPQGVAWLRKPADGAMLHVVARAHGGGEIALAPRPFGDTRIDFSDFPQYGPQSVTLDVAFDAGAAAVAVETLALDADGDAAVDAWAFDPTHARRDIAWRCRDPFRCGLRWRWRAAVGETPWPWSEPLAPGSLARLAASERRRAS